MIAKPTGKTWAIILAAGKGTRMNNGEPSPIPKVLYEVSGRALINFSIEALKEAGLPKIVIVIGYLGEMVQEYLGKNYLYAVQKQMLGTADAVRTALQVLPRDVKTVLVTNGDDFYSSKDISDLLNYHSSHKNKVTVMTARPTDPTGYGRILRDGNKVAAIVEEKLATDEQKMVSEVSTGLWVFEVMWLQEAIKEVKQNEVGEYYLTDVLSLAASSDVRVGGYAMNDIDGWFGVNNPKQLAEAKKRLNDLVG